MSCSKTTEAFSELLNPVKDPERSFAINISELLQSYVRSFLDGSVNFNSAALMIQGSSSIYGKKVEYLHNLATKLYASLLRNKKEDGAKKETKEREKHSKESKFSDPFCSTEIKLGKNLSCLRKKFAAKNAASKKTSKKADKRCTHTPVDLFPLEEDDKGIEIQDTDGTKLGRKYDRKYDFIMSKCTVTTSGWLLLPFVSPDLIPSQFSNPDYSYENEDSDDNVFNGWDDNMPESSPFDEGYPPSSGCSETPLPSSQGTSSVPSSQGTDEGLGSLPCTPLENGSQPETGTSTEGSSEPESNDNTPTVSPTETPMEVVQERPDGLLHAIEGNENIPLDDAGVAPRPRRSMRQALKLCQLQEDGAPKEAEENALASTEKEEVAVVKKAIQKKNTCNLPSKLKANEARVLNPASEYCARTFFSMDRKYPKKLPHSFEVSSFQNHNKLNEKFRQIQATLLAIHQRRKDKTKEDALEENDEEDEEIDADGVESEADEIENNLDDPATNDDITTAPLTAAEIVIENNPVLPHPTSDNENPLAEDEPMFVEDLDDGLGAYNVKELEDSFTNAARLQCDLFREDLQQYVQTSDISERVRAWEATMKPFLEELNQREEFDINLYGSRILNAFQDSNRKQTITFRNFCKGKEKWEIHRYFMALLPLVNIGNVSIEPEDIGDNEEDILVTLLSRKMHHKELEEFGHNEGEHS